MKYNKKVLNILAALAVAVPMVAPLSNIDSVFAETVEFTKHDEDGSSDKLGGASYEFYLIGTGEKADQKLFSATTKSDGTIDSSTISNKNYVDTDGKINLNPGSYYAKEVKAPEGYMLNVSHEVFLVDKDVSNVPVKVSDKKFKEGYGQVVVESKDKKTGAPIPSAVYSLEKKEGNEYKMIATLYTNDDGYFISATDVETYNGTLVLPVGQYAIKETVAPGNYALNNGAIQFDVKDGQTKEIPVLHAVKTDLNNTVQNGNSTLMSNIDKSTGVKIRIVNSNNTKKAMPNVGVSVYSVDKNGKETMVFDGKTNSDGYLSSNGAKVGSNIVNNNTLYVSPGKYYYKLSEYPNSKKHHFTVEKGKIGDQILQLNVSGSSSRPSNVKRSSNGSSSSRLAKTGSEDTAIYTAAGVALVAAGAVVAGRKKKENR